MVATTLTYLNNVTLPSDGLGNAVKLATALDNEKNARE